jgi:hypothetical protein
MRVILRVAPYAQALSRDFNGERMKTVYFILTVLIASGCGGSTTSQPTSSPAASRCSPASPALVNAISTGLQERLTLRNARVVRSSDFDQAYFIAADLDGPGLDGDADIATWVSNRSDGTGSVYSVGAVAAEFSDWGRGEETDAGFALSDDGASEAGACARSA